MATHIYSDKDGFDRPLRTLCGLSYQEVIGQHDFLIYKQNIDNMNQIQLMRVCNRCLSHPIAQIKLLDIIEL